MLSLAVPRIWMKAFLVALAVLGPLVVLALAHAYAPALDAAKRCFAAGLAGFVHAQWPKWIWCVLATHESLTAGLISSIVALSAALIALQQIGDARKKFEAAEKHRTERERVRDQRDQARYDREQRRELLELRDIERVVRYYDRLLTPFKEADGADDAFATLSKLAKTGGLPPFKGSLPADLRHLVRDTFARLSSFNKSIKELEKNVGEPDAMARNQINENIQSLVMTMSERRDDAQDQLDERKSVAGP